MNTEKLELEPGYLLFWERYSNRKNIFNFTLY